MVVVTEHIVDGNKLISIHPNCKDVSFEGDKVTFSAYDNSLSTYLEKTVNSEEVVALVRRRDDVESLVLPLLDWYNN